jgi:GTP-binding protein EngB required for normal cell division
MAQTKAIGEGKDTLAGILEHIRIIQGQYSLSAIQPNLEACETVLESQDTIDVGVFGRFKAGKSSLLNLLARKPVLPVGVTPVTAVITRLRYSPCERIMVRYSNGSSETIPLELVQSFVSEAENPRNTKKVASVTIELPSLKPYHCLQFVDTPGLESVFQHNTEMALDWLPKVGLALVTVSVDPPLSKHDVALIRTLLGYTPRVVVLLTKADLVAESEKQEIAEFIRTELLKEFGSKFRVVPFSTRPDYEHLKAALDEDLLLPLVENRDSTRLHIVQFKFNSLLDKTREYLSLALAAAERAEADRSRLKLQILNEKTNYESIRMDLLALATDCAGRTRPWIMKRLEELRADVEGRIARELRQKLSGMQSNLWKLSRTFEGWLHELMRCEMKDISFNEGDLFRVPLERARDTLTKTVQGFRDRLAGNIEQALGTRFSIEPFEIERNNPTIPDIAISNLFMFNTDLLWFVIPMWLFRSWADRHFLNRIPYETEKNLSRLASQWTDGINGAILKMQRDAERSVREQILTIEALLSRTRSDSQAIRASLSEMELMKGMILQQ